jgi:hypothetical protein
MSHKRDIPAEKVVTAMHAAVDVPLCGSLGQSHLFMALSHAIQHFFVTRVAPYPIERTLLTTCQRPPCKRLFHEVIKARFRRVSRPLWGCTQKSGSQKPLQRPLMNLGAGNRKILP